jgi:hypothetical protein
LGFRARSEEEARSIDDFTALDAGPNHFFNVYVVCAKTS